MIANGCKERMRGPHQVNTNDNDIVLTTNRTRKTPRFCYKHNKRKTTLTRTTTLLLLLTTLFHPTPSQATDNYCGSTWVEAANDCSLPCPSSTNSECTTPGHTCFKFTGCQAKIEATEAPSISPTKFPTSSPTISSPPTITPPTGTPTYTPSASPSSSPSSFPTASPIVNWYPYIDTTVSTLTNGGGIMFVEDDPSSRSYGSIFELESAPSSPAIRIHSFEILLSYDDELFSDVATATTATPNGNITGAKTTVEYELWMRSNTWHGFEGRVRAFDKLTSGNVTITNGQTNHRGEKLITVTIDKFDPIKMDGGGLERRAMYVTLSRRNLLYQRSSLPLETEAISSIEEVETQVVIEDTIVLAETDHLIVYEGAAVMTYPFKEAKESIFYRMPRGFVGRIGYDRDPCELIPLIENGTDTGKLTSVTRWEDCTEGTKAPRPTIEPTKWVKPRWTLAPTTKAPTDAPVPLPEVDDPTNSPVLSPTGVPSISMQPTAYIMKSFIIMTFNNIRTEREMDARERNSFEKKLVSFLNSKKAVKTNEVTILEAKVWYQQVFTTEESSQVVNKIGKKNGSRDRVLQEGGSSGAIEAAPDSSISSGGGMDLIVPSPPVSPQLEVTVILSIESSPLPQKITSQLLETMIRNSKTEFVAEIKEIESLSDLFAATTDIPTVMSVDQLTKAPTRRPTRAPVVPVTEEEEAPGLFSTPTMIFLLIIGLIWIALVLVSFAKIKKARRIMKVEHAKRFLGEASFKTPHHGMVYGEEKKEEDLNTSKKGMRASLLGAFSGRKKSSMTQPTVKSSYKDKKDYHSDGNYSEQSEEDMSSMEDSYSSGESLSEESSSSSGSSYGGLQ